MFEKNFINYIFIEFSLVMCHAFPQVLMVCTLATESIQMFSPKGQAMRRICTQWPPMEATARILFFHCGAVFEVSD